jgi:MoaA/NifB/PqqE/SkfB family radical SAM enzyme
VALELSTACQLKCPSCPTATGVIAKSLGAGFLTVADFRKFLQEHPWVSDIELSNWGEAFLNPDLEQILCHAYRHHVALRIDNGANLDRASDRVLKAVVKYKLRSLSCSIDGASQEVYSVYRVKGDFDRVIGHIRQINAFKKKYRSPYPAYAGSLSPSATTSTRSAKPGTCPASWGCSFI